MNILSKRIKASVVLFAFVAYMPLAMLPSFAASVPGPDSIPGNTHPVLDSSINGGYVGWHGGSESTANGKYDVNMDPTLGAGGVAQFDWGSFNVGKNVIVDWIFSNHSQTAINRVLNGGGMSKIYGKLTSSCGVGANCGDAGTNRTGNVILINPNGILFGAGSKVDLNSFTASTYDISGMKNIKDLVNGNYLEGTLTSNVKYTGINNYKFSGEDKITANYKYGKRISFNPGAIGADGNGIILETAGFNNVGNTKAKSVALVSDKININDSVIETYVSTGTQGNTLGSTKSQTDSNIKLVTADGVSFVYSNHGAIRDDAGINVSIKENAGANDGLKITGNSFIKSGSVQAVNGVRGKDIVINNSTIESHKLYNGPSGTIGLESSGNIDIKNSRLETLQAYDDVANVNNLKNYGNIDIAAANNIKIDNTRIYSAPSNKNKGDKATVGNIKIESTGGNVEITKTAGVVNEQVKYEENGVTKYAPVNIVSGGNTDILALNGDVIINLDNTSKIHADGYNKNGDLNIKGGDVEINNALLGGNNVMLSALSIQDGTGNLLGGGGLKLINSKVNAQNSLSLIGLNTTLADSNLSYNTINFYNNYMDTYNLNNNVEIKDGTTLNDRLANKGDKDFELKTNGDLIITNNKLQRKGVSEVAPDSDDNALKNQSANIKLTSTKGQVSIRKNSDITTNGSISLNGHTNASVSTSILNAGKDINLTAGTKVTVGNVNEDNTTGRNSVLNAGGNINLLAKGNVNDPTDKNNIKGVAIVGAEFNGNDISTVAENGDVKSTSGIFNAKNNNKMDAKNGKVLISRSNITAAKNNNINAKTNVTVQNNSNITAETSDITAGTYVYLNGSTVETTGNNNLTANGTTTGAYPDNVDISNSTIRSTNGDVTITQLVAMDIDKQIHNGSAITSGGNINLYANGTGSNITASNLDALTYNGRLNLTAANDIALDSQNAWYVDRVTFNAGHNTLINSAKNVTTNSVRLDSANENTIAAVTDILINNAMDIQTGKTTLTTTTGTIKTETNNGVINANQNKLIANAGTEINIAFTGVDNKSKGLEINSNVDTHITDAGLNGKNVTLTAKDGKIAIAKLKSDNLTINQPAQILAATDNKANAATDNISADTPNTFKNKAYIEIKGLAGWNMDRDIANTENMPPFYIDGQHFDSVEIGENNYHQKHFISFNDSEDFMLVYKRTGKDCIIPPDPDNPTADTAVSTYTKLPKHGEDVSPIAPVLNEITDPTANVIMAAARLSLDEEDKNDEEDKF